MINPNITLHYSSKEEIENYFSDENYMNQSFLKGYLGGLEYKSLRGPKEKDELYYYENVNFLLGDYLDGYLTQGENFVEENYFSESIAEKPSDTVMSIVQFYFDNISKVSLYEPESESALIEYARSISYRDKYGDKALVDTIRKEGTYYYTYLQRAQGKKIISEEEEIILKALLRKLDTSEHKNKIFTAPWKYLNEEKDENCTYQIFFQKPIYFVYKGVKCKGLIDILILKVSKEGGHILKAHIIDLKTTGTPALAFNEAVDRFRYDVQIAFYRTGVAETYSISEKDIDCSFLVLGKNDLNEPMLRINVGAEILERGKYGDQNLKEEFDNNSNIFYVKSLYGSEVFFGFEWALKSYKYYLEKSPEDPGEIIKEFGTEYMLVRTGLI